MVDVFQWGNMKNHIQQTQGETKKKFQLQNPWEIQDPKMEVR